MKLQCNSKTKLAFLACDPLLRMVIDAPALAISCNHYPATQWSNVMEPVSMS